MNSVTQEKKMLATIVRNLTDGETARKIVIVDNAVYSFSWRVARFVQNKEEKFLIILGKPFIEKLKASDWLGAIEILKVAIGAVKDSDSRLVKKLDAIMVKDSDFDWEVTVTAKHKKLQVVLQDTRSDFLTHESISSIHEQAATIMLIMAENL